MIEPRGSRIERGVEEAHRDETSRRGSGGGVLLVCLAIALAPLFAVEYPPLLDYPNHLARIHILIHPEDPHLERYWRVEWSLLPNLGFDLVSYALARFMPVELAGRVFLGLSLAVVLSAPLALHRALYGRLSLLPLMAGALVFNRVLQMGFLGYFLGLGLAIWAYAGWLTLRGRGTGLRLAVMQAVALVLFVCHLYAMAVLAVLVVLSAAGAGWRAASGTAIARLRGTVGAALREALPFVFPLVLLVAASETGSAGSGLVYREPFSKLLMLPLAMMPQMNLLVLPLVAAALATPGIARLGGGRMMHPAVTWPAAGMLALYLIMPFRVLSSENADWRLLVPLALVVVGAAEDPFRSFKARARLMLLVIVITAGATWNAWGYWRDGDRVLADFRAATAPVERGALLVPWVPGDPGFRKSYGPPSVVHVTALAVIDRAALVPTVFALEGQQPIALREPYKAARNWHAWLERETGGTPPPIDGFDVPGRYVLEIQADGREGQTSPGMPVPAQAVTRAGRFTLWRLE